MKNDIETIKERFFKKVDKTKGCWIWKGIVLSGGYGQFAVNGKQILAHRFSYEVNKGKIPKGLHIDHLCRNRLCVNHLHLEAVTPRENILRGIGSAAINARKTHCVRGHSFQENAYVNHKGQRICNECKRIATRIARIKYPNMKRSPYDPEKRRILYLKKRILKGTANKNKTHCKWGHKFTEKNTYKWTNRRYCIKCRDKRLKERVFK